MIRRGAFLCFLFACFSHLYSQPINLAEVKAREEFRWGVEAFHRRYLSQAILSFQRAIAHQPNDPLTRIWLGRAFLQSGFEDAGLAELNRVLQSGYRDLFLQNWVELLEAGRGLRRDLRPPSRWVFTTEVSGIRGDAVLFRNPTVVRPREDGSFFVVSYVTNEIVLMDVNGVPIRYLRGGLQGFDRPFDLVEGPDGSIYISEFRGNRIAISNPQGVKTKVFGSRGRGPGSLLGPQYLALDEEGNLFVTEAGNRRVSKFDGTGRFITTFGFRTEFFEGLNLPTGILVKNDKVYVADKNNKSIEVFDLSGNYITSLLRGRLQEPEGLSRLGEYILIADGRRLLQYDVETDNLIPLLEFGAQAQRILRFSPDANGNLLAADFGANSVHILNDLSELYAGLMVRIQRVHASTHPEVFLDVRVTDRLGNPVVGLQEGNFILTEGRHRVRNLELMFASHRIDRFDTVILVDRSPQAFTVREAMGRIAGELSRILGHRSDIRVVSTSPVPGIIFRPQERLTLIPQRVIDTPQAYSPAWALDLGIRLAATELLASRTRKAIFFLTAGDLPPHSFNQFGLQETAAYMRNNGIVFYPIFITPDGGSRELEFLARETGGKVHRIHDPRGLSILEKDLLQQNDGVYVLRYNSTADTEFGRRYIPLSLEVRLVQRSGREEMGYFGPLR